MHKNNKIPKPRNIAIVALPENRTELIEWAFDNKKILKDKMIISNGETAQWIEDTIHTSIKHLSCGTNGGFEELADEIRNNNVDALIFFGNPADAGKTLKEIEYLLPAAIEKNIVTAFNTATANLFIGANDSQIDVQPAANRRVKPVTTIPTFFYSTGNWLRKIAAIA